MISPALTRQRHQVVVDNVQPCALPWEELNRELNKDGMLVIIKLILMSIKCLLDPSPELSNNILATVTRHSRYARPEIFSHVQMTHSCSNSSDYLGPKRFEGISSNICKTKDIIKLLL